MSCVYSIVFDFDAHTRGVTMIHITKELLINELKTKTPTQIAKQFGCHAETIRRKIKNFQIKRSRHSHLIHDTLFSQWNTDMAYILGFTLADGNVNTSLHHHQIAYQLQSGDEEILQYIKSVVQPTAKIYRYDRRNVNGSISHVSHLVFSSKAMVRDLETLGCVPNKTYVDLRMPNVPKQFLGDFVRGVFDGDGCVTSSGKKAWANISCNSVRFLEDLVTNTGFGYVSYSDKPPRFVCASKSNMQRFYDLMYVNNLAFKLERKYIKFKEILYGQ